jgi:hypothetical protein
VGAGVVLGEGLGAAAVARLEAVMERPASAARPGGGGGGGGGRVNSRPPSAASRAGREARAGAREPTAAPRGVRLPEGVRPPPAHALSRLLEGEEEWEAGAARMDSHLSVLGLSDSVRAPRSELSSQPGGHATEVEAGDAPFSGAALEAAAAVAASPAAPRGDGEAPAGYAASDAAGGSADAVQSVEAEDSMAALADAMAAAAGTAQQR